MPNYLYRVDDVTTTPAWENITPQSDYSPELPYALAINGQEVELVDCIGNNDDDIDTKYWVSGDFGDTWDTPIDDTWSTVKTSGDLIVLGGVNVIAISFDGGDSASDKTGNLVSIMGEDFITKQVLVLLVQE